MLAISKIDAGRSFTHYHVLGILCGIICIRSHSFKNTILGVVRPYAINVRFPTSSSTTEL